MKGITAIMVMRLPHQLPMGSISLSTMDRAVFIATLWMGNRSGIVTWAK